jgi:hypothetical protein
MCSRPLGARTSSPVPSRTRVAQGLLILYFVGSIAVALPLLFSFGRAGDLVNTTSGKVLGAALLSLGVGALVAARDPWRNRVMIQVLIIFTTLSTLAIVYRLIVERHHHDVSWFLLPVAAAAPVLLAIFYPRQPAS